MAQFTLQNLTNDRVLVKGTDASGTTGTTVLFATEWRSIKAHKDYQSATADFEAKVEEFFAPLTEAAEKLNAAHAPKVDPITYVVLEEGVEATAGAERTVLKLGRDSVVLRLIEAGDFDRLVWVDDSLEVLEVLDDTAVPTVTETLADIVADETEGDSAQG